MLVLPETASGGPLGSTQTAMSYVRGGIVDIPPVSSGNPSNPLLGYDGTLPAPPSAVTSTATTSQSTLKHQILLYDQRCLITGAVSTQLQVCHLVNAVRVDKSKSKLKQEEKIAMKGAVEHILTRQQFGIGAFFLDSLPNCILLESQWHGDLDIYGSFCITIPYRQLDALLQELRAKNLDWTCRATSNPHAKRNLDLTAAPFVVKDLVLLVIRKDLFLPDNRAVEIVTQRALRALVPNAPLPTVSRWVPYHPSKQTPYLMNVFNQSFFEFPFESLRHPSDRLSIFSLLVNANSKLRSHTHTLDDPMLQPHAIMVGHAVREIFYVPDQVKNQALPTDSRTLSPPSEEDSNGSEPDTPTRSNRDRADRQEQDDTQGQRSVDLDLQEGGAVEEDRSDLNFGFGESGYDLEEDEDPDTINGLTFPEMRTVLQRVSDGAISGEERAEAAMLMLGMAGGHKRPQAISPLIDYT